MATPKTKERETENPTILIVQGSFQTPAFYTPLHTYLHSLNYPTVHPVLPSCTPPIDSSTTLLSDAQAVETELSRLVVQENKIVIVVMHSYGGLVGSTAIPSTLTRKSRKERGEQGGVLHLFYFCAFVLPVGQSVLSAFGESPNKELHGDGTFSLKDAGEVLFNDFSAQEAEAWVEKMVSQSYAVQGTEMERAAYEYIPATYLVCEKDSACPAAYQELVAERVGARIVRCREGHMPHLSWTQGLGDLIVEVVEGIVEPSGDDER